jgi:hypothetical protein
VVYAPNMAALYRYIGRRRVLHLAYNCTIAARAGQPAAEMERVWAQSACLFYHVCTRQHLQSWSMIQRGTRRRRRRLQENHPRGAFRQGCSSGTAEQQRCRTKCVGGEIFKRDAHSGEGSRLASRRRLRSGWREGMVLSAWAGHHAAGI